MPRAPLGPSFKHIIRNFSGGLLEDKRQQSPSHFSITKHFDTFTYPVKLVPYAQTISSNGTTNPSSPTTLQIINFLYAPISASTYQQFGLGVDPATGHTKLYTFDIDAGTPNTTVWSPATNGTSSNAGRDFNVFFYYKGYIYNYTQGTTIQRADATGSLAFTDNYQAITYTTGVQALRHPSDDIAYFFGDNIVYSLNNTSWNGAVLTLPSTERIVSRCAFGNYLAIGTVTVGNIDIRSTVYLWDRDSSLTTLTSRIDFGAGTVTHLANLNNKLIGVMDYYLNSSYSLYKGKVQVKQANGDFAVTLNEITTDAITNPSLVRTNFIADDKLYFPMQATLNGDSRLGIWAVDQNGKIALDFVESAATSYQAIFKTANIWWMAHSGTGAVTHSDATNVYSATNASIYETLILSTVAVTPRGTIIMNPTVTKTLVGVTVITEPLPSGASVTMKYRKDSETAWTTIFTNSTLNSTSHDAVNIESSGALLPDYKEIQFQISSLGGAAVTGIEYGAETKDTNLY